MSVLISLSIVPIKHFFSRYRLPHAFFLVLAFSVRFFFVLLWRTFCMVSCISTALYNNQQSVYLCLCKCKFLLIYMIFIEFFSRHLSNYLRNDSVLWFWQLWVVHRIHISRPVFISLLNLATRISDEILASESPHWMKINKSKFIFRQTFSMKMFTIKLIFFFTRKLNREKWLFLVLTEAKLLLSQTTLRTMNQFQCHYNV